MHYILITLYIIMFLITIALGVYNLLFALQAGKVEKELSVIFPSVSKNILIVNMALSFLTGAFIIFSILRII